MLKTFLLAAALTGGTFAAAHAQAGGPRPDPLGDGTVSRADAQAKAAAEFDRLDTNRDGALSSGELAAMFPEGPMRAMSGMMARMADTNGDGKIDRSEFVTAAMRRFDRADANGDGQLTKAERDAERDARRARRGMGDGAMGNGPMGDHGPGGEMGDPGERPMGRDDGTPMPPPPDDDGQ